MSTIKVRDARAEDEACWRVLWAQYVAFYEATVSDGVTTHTWQRILASAEGVLGRVAVVDGEVAGISVSVLHAGTWTAGPICYLEDLFVDPAYRGGGVGRALIDDLMTLGRERGWTRLYWHTRSSNAAARKLYDAYGPADDFVRYLFPIS